MNNEPLLAARLFFVEEELRSAHHMISFLRDCLTGKADYTYPNQTARALLDIEALVVIRVDDGCPHAYYRDDCAPCARNAEKWAEARKHAAALGWNVEPGSWPRPPR